MRSAAAAGGASAAGAPAPGMQYSRYDQERFGTGRAEETAGFGIDTMGTYHGKGLASMVGAAGGGGAPASSAAPAPRRPGNATPSYASRDPPTGTPRAAALTPRASGGATPNMTPDPCE